MAVAKAPEDVQSDDLRFGFGRNWSDYVKTSFSEERVRTAQKHLLDFLGLQTLAGKSFLDIGCGSGLHSLAALRAGAERIFSFDYDPESVATTLRLREGVGSPEHWRVERGDVLSEEYVGGLEEADIVYSWGVLHHTGSMWKAIENASRPLASGGVFYIALYSSDVYLDPTPARWIEIKKRYNRSGAARKRMMEWGYFVRHNLIPDLRSRRNPLAYIRGYSKSRGMDYWTDVRDWLGGYPMEFAGNQETKRFASERLGLETINVAAGAGNTEFLFRRRGASNYWDSVVAGMAEEKPLAGEARHAGGRAYAVPLPEEAATADGPEHPKRSTLMLYEDGVPLGFAHAVHDHIRAHGAGRYSHWRDELLFSATDGSDPRSNGRRYTYRIDGLLVSH